MTNEKDPAERLAEAAERIADALQYLVRASGASAAHARLRVARAPSDNSHMEAVNLDHEAKLVVIVQNVGDADTTLVEPTVEIAGQRVSGGVIGRDGQPHSSGPLPASASGSGVIVHFQLAGQATSLAKLPMTVRLPHTPGQFIGRTLHEVRMEPSGQAEGRYNWRQVEAKDIPEN